ncbi:hypothetical protein H6F67_16145 [Microcoleus sp. FACHB-1515]|uniref:hypothetical protein n=1 Tax=Cyanophyceae TaxID=3028117 RepID=UPI0016875362|nr:hypothetical protein [Microcoleus sp. FACHB-1515]MBD2091379.1 hypothetical protein [Microcoleus sp. FACHB-1515]
MSELATAAIETQLLLSQYNFDLGSWTMERLIDRWLQMYPVEWLRSAAIEALYQGRYKAVSVEQILAVWQRRKRPLPHFNSDFERMICSEILLPVRAEPPLKLLPDTAPEPESIATEIAPYHPPDIDSGKLTQLHEEASAIATDTIAPYHPPNIDSGKLARLNSTRLLAVVERMAAPIDRFVPDPTPPDFYAKLRAVAQHPLDDSEAAS